MFAKKFIWSREPVKDHTLLFGVLNLTLRIELLLLFRALLSELGDGACCSYIGKNARFYKRAHYVASLLWPSYVTDDRLSFDPPDEEDGDFFFGIGTMECGDDEE